MSGHRQTIELQFVSSCSLKLESVARGKHLNILKWLRLFPLKCVACTSLLIRLSVSVSVSMRPPVITISQGCTIFDLTAEMFKLFLCSHLFVDHDRAQIRPCSQTELALFEFTYIFIHHVH